MFHSNPDATALVLRESDEWLAVATQFVHLTRKDTPSLCMIVSSDLPNLDVRGFAASAIMWRSLTQGVMSYSKCPKEVG